MDERSGSRAIGWIEGWGRMAEGTPGRDAYRFESCDLH